MDVRLNIEKGSSRTRAVRLRGVQTIIGRQKGCGLRIPSGQVSRRHCVLTVHDDYVTVDDLESVNGTFLNGARISGRQVVRPGDRLEVGPVGFTVEYQPSQQALGRMPGLAEPAPAGGDELEVLPLAEDDLAAAEAIEMAPDVEPMEALPLEPAPGSPAGDDVLEPIPLEEDEHVETMAEGWKLPEADDLRDLLSQMEDKKKPKP
jgi:predicted component of type VI protein secretion system